VFKVDPEGYETLYSFMGPPADGAGPWSPLLLDANGNLYGTTNSGGSSSACRGGCGTVFRLTPNGSGWTETVLYSFSGGADGGGPYAGLKSVWRCLLRWRLERHQPRLRSKRQSSRLWSGLQAHAVTDKRAMPVSLPGIAFDTSDQYRYVGQHPAIALAPPLGRKTPKPPNWLPRC
jgi:uncharacterized repeat protein (TIGR03803 family)